VSPDRPQAPPAAPLAALVEAWLEGDVTALEAGRRIDLAEREALYAPTPAHDELVRLFPPRPGADPDPAAARLLLRALDLDARAEATVAALARRRALLAAVFELGPGDAVMDVVLRPGERVLLGTAGGREALAAALAGDPGPFLAWLGRTVLDPDAFTATTVDVPLHGLDDLHELVGRLADATDALAPGRARAMVADEWVAETTVAALAEEVPYEDIARAIGTALLEHDAPILLWHAVHELALVTEDDPELRARMLARSLVVADREAGRCPAEAAAPLLAELGTRGAIRTLDALAPALDVRAWQAIAKGYLRRAIADAWHDWREDVRRWAAEDDAVRALAAFDALLRSPAPEPGAVEWFTESPAESVRLACRARLGLEG
jgi:hypothetical protein